MTPLSFVGLCTAMLILAASPGPGVFATVSRSLATGFRSSLPVILGIVVGDIIFLMLAVFGMAAIAHTLGGLFVGVRIAGGIYLIWLGIRTWVSWLPEDLPVTGQAGWTDTGALLSGLLITLSNPKVILFYCGFLPTFMDLSALRTIDPSIVVAVVTIASILAAVLTIYAYLAGRARRVFDSRSALKRMHRVAGGIMVATGITVAARS
jgi:threonine/homoserine/homoserine lactone efflux protein